MTGEVIREDISHCGACKLCFEVCPSYEKTGDERYSPMHRLMVVKQLLEGSGHGDVMRKTIDDCTLCGECDDVCSEGIAITEAVRFAKAILK
ncbi:MAG: (Fe-S)-binding protein [Dehalococcoidia bacterium]|nr:(Fe-S)-binding protein [Dehalococcoidia bacterium]